MVEMAAFTQVICMHAFENAEMETDFPFFVSKSYTDDFGNGWVV
jgi:hypothetical protein